MAIEVIRVMNNQIWIYDDHIDKNETEENDFCIRGERPVLVLQVSGMRATCLPITSSPSLSAKYKPLNCGIQFANREELSTVVIDNVITVNCSELKSYVGVLKDITVERIKKAFIEYIKGNTEYDFFQKTYVYTNDANNNQTPIINKTTTIQESDKEEKGTKYTPEEIEFMLTRSVKESMDKFGLTAKQIYSLRYRNKDIMK